MSHIALKMFDNAIKYSSIIKNNQTCESILLSGNRSLGELSRDIHFHCHDSCKETIDMRIINNAIELINHSSNFAFKYGCDQEVREMLVINPVFVFNMGIIDLALECTINQGILSEAYRLNHHSDVVNAIIGLIVSSVRIIEASTLFTKDLFSIQMDKLEG